MFLVRCAKLDKIRRAVLVALGIRLPFGLSGDRIKRSLVFLLECCVFRLVIVFNVTRRADDGNVMLVEKLELGREPLVAVFEVPDDHVFDLPMFLHFAPDRPNVLPIFVADNREIRLGGLGHVCHPFFREVRRQDVGFEIAPVALRAESCHRVTVFLFAVQIIQNIWRIGHAHVGLLAVHELYKVRLNRGIAAHHAAVPKLPYVAFLDFYGRDAQLLQLFFKVKSLRRIFTVKDAIKLVRAKSDLGKERLIEFREQLEIKFSGVLVEPQVEFLFTFYVWNIHEDDGDVGHAELLGYFGTEMSTDDDVRTLGRGVDDDRIDEAEFLNALLELRRLIRVMHAGIVGGGLERCERDVLHSDLLGVLLGDFAFWHTICWVNGLNKKCPTCRLTQKNQKTFCEHPTGGHIRDFRLAGVYRLN